MRQSCQVGVIGAGAIGTALITELIAGRITGACFGGSVASRLDGDAAVFDLARGCDLLVEAAGIGAVATAFDAAEASGTRLVVCSTGAFADERLLERLERAQASGRVDLVAGAIGGLDLLRAAYRGSAMMSVTLTTTKAPVALDVPDRAAVATVFTGSAREAISRFPKTANVAVTLALATVGLDATTVVVRADPSALRTRHIIEADSTVGHYRFEIDNAVAAGSGARTSAITIWSAVDAIERAARLPIATRDRDALQVRELSD